MDLKIYICTHTDFEKPVSNPVYEVLDSRRLFPGDIAPNGLKASFYCELLSYKYIADHTILPKYIGFCGYRKYFSFFDDIPPIGDYDVITTTPRIFNTDVRGQYARSHNVEDLDIASGIIKELYPSFYPHFEAHMKERELHLSNVFIMRRGDFLSLIDMIFAVLDRYLEIVGNVSVRLQNHAEDYLHRGIGNSLKYQYRIGGYLGERITSAYIRTLGKRKEYDLVFTSERL